MKYMRMALFLALCFMVCVARATDYDITAFGAKGNGLADDTEAIQRAIDACATKGGRVVFPAGKYLSATIELKSNVTLYFSSGAVLMGMKESAKYRYLKAGIHFYGEDWARQSLIYANDAENIAIEGSGTIDGQGASFVVNTIKKPDRYKDRPYLLWFVRCKKVRVKDVHLRNSAFWMQHYLGCEDVLIDGISVWNHSNKNNDMLDIDGCKNVIVNNVNGDSDDDGITLKSTSPLISENITITNCVISSHCNALKFGTESTGGFRNITISNCVVRPSRQTSTIYGLPAGNSGISLEMVDGGIMENITISNVVIEGPQVPLFIRLGNRARKFMESAEEPPIGIVRNIRISDVVAVGADMTGCSITGLENGLIEGVALSNISITTSGGAKSEDMFRKPETLEKAYPEATMFGMLPAYGLYIKHVKGITLNNIRFAFDQEDERPAIMLEEVQDFGINGLTAALSDRANAAIYLKNATGGLVTNCRGLAGAKHFIWKEGDCSALWQSGNFLPGIQEDNIFNLRGN